MRRWFAIFLLCLLPLQFSWSAAAAYCGHEADPQTSHPGHHGHQHAGQDSDAPRADPGTGPGLDVDCGLCHGSIASLPAAAGGPAPLTATARPATPVAGRLRTLPQSPPERPQWAALA